MRLEALLVLALVIGLPLLERLLERRRSRRPAPDAPRPRMPKAKAKPKPTPRPPGHPPPATVAAKKVRVEAAPVPSEVPAQRPVRAPARAPRQPVPPPSARMNRSDLRRAVVLMTVLGPCKALDRETPAWETR